jgi:hypothetical protein
MPLANPGAHTTRIHPSFIIIFNRTARTLFNPSFPQKIAPWFLPEGPFMFLKNSIIQSIIKSIQTSEPSRPTQLDGTQLDSQSSSNKKDRAAACT